MRAGPSVADPNNDKTLGLSVPAIIAIASFLLLSVVVIVVLIRLPPVGLPLLLPHIKSLDGGVNRHLLHTPMRTTDKEVSYVVKLAMF